MCIGCLIPRLIPRELALTQFCLFLRFPLSVEDKFQHGKIVIDDSGLKKDNNEDDALTLKSEELEVRNYRIKSIKQFYISVSQSFLSNPHGTS